MKWKVGAVACPCPDTLSGWRLGRDKPLPYNSSARRALVAVHLRERVVSSQVIVEEAFMLASLILSGALLIGFVIPGCKPCACLQKDIQPTDVVSAPTKKPGRAGRRVTVDDKLKELKARCKRSKLVDSTGREIFFYRMVGCWGNPPEGYSEILERQNAELAKLRKHYHVMEMTCNASGEQPY